VGAVLLIVCLNVANLLLARGVARRPEMALRAALGAARGRLVRLVLWESLLLSLGGALLGLALGYAVLEILIAAAPAGIPRLTMVSLDGRVVAVMAGTALACGLGAGIVPAWLDSRPNLQHGLAGAPTSSPTAQGSRIRKGLVVSEVALATVLVIVAGLLASSFHRMIEFDRGFSQLSLLEIRIGPSDRHTHGSDDGVRQLYNDLRTRLQSLPGVQSVALSSTSPMSPGGLRVAIEIEGLEAPPQSSSVQLRFASHDFFSAAGIPLLEGRPFDPGLDHASSERVALVNRAFVQAFGLRSGATGHRVLMTSLRNGSEVPTLRIVGAVADLRPQIDSSPRPAIYVPFEQRAWAYMRLLVRLQGDPVQAAPMLREQIWSVAPDVTVDSIRSLGQMVSESLSGPRFSAALVGSFAVLALALAALGLYGVVSYSVSRQSRELAIRRALGAGQGGLAWLVLSRGLALLLAGIAAGIPAAASAAWLLSSQLYALSPAEFPVYLVTILTLSAAGTLSCLLPAAPSKSTLPSSCGTSSGLHLCTALPGTSSQFAVGSRRVPGSSIRKSGI
ncbi:MAG: FtsX-like permease family protein, partial [Acidobacteriota bacterium]